MARKRQRQQVGELADQENAAPKTAKDLPTASAGQRAEESDITVMVPNEEIARLAYELWEKGGRVHGDDWKYWLEAERRLCAKEAGKAIRGQNGRRPASC